MDDIYRRIRNHDSAELTAIINTKDKIVLSGNVKALDKLIEIRKINASRVQECEWDGDMNVGVAKCRRVGAESLQ
jgi:hypothetical protein